jgi:hypothetical protein
MLRRGELAGEGDEPVGVASAGQGAEDLLESIEDA